MDTWESIPQSWLDELRLLESTEASTKRPVQFSLRAVLITTAALSLCFAAVATVLRDVTAESAGKWIQHQVESGFTVDILLRMIQITLSVVLGMGVVLVPLLSLRAWGRWRGGQLLLRVAPARPAWQFVVMLCVIVSVVTRAFIIANTGLADLWDYLALGTMSGLLVVVLALIKWSAKLEFCENGVVTCGITFRSWESIRQRASMIFWRGSFYVGRTGARRKVDVPVQRWNDVQNLLGEYVGATGLPDATRPI